MDHPTADASAVRILDAPERFAPAGDAPQPIRAERAVQLALDAARQNDGTLTRQTCPPEIRGGVLEADADARVCTGSLWRWIAWQAGARGGAIVYTAADGRRLRFRLDAALAAGGGYWYASHYDRRTARTLNVYVGTHRSGAAEAHGMERGACRIAAKLSEA